VRSQVDGDRVPPLKHAALDARAPHPAETLRSPHDSVGPVGLPVVREVAGSNDREVQDPAVRSDFEHLEGRRGLPDRDEPGHFARAHQRRAVPDDQGFRDPVIAPVERDEAAGRAERVERGSDPVLRAGEVHRVSFGAARCRDWPCCLRAQGRLWIRRGRGEGEEEESPGKSSRRISHSVSLPARGARARVLLNANSTSYPERMTAEIKRLEEQLGRVLEGGAWHGPSVLELLSGLPAAQASSRPIAGAHSIWEIVLHLASDYGLVLRRLAGDGSPLTAAEGWPTCPAPTEENWQRTVQELELGNKKLRQAVLDFPTRRLDEPLVPEIPYT